MKYVIGLGEVLWDVLPSGKQIGGAPANFAFHVSQFGIPVRVVSAIGDDDLGRETREVFAKRNLIAIMPSLPQPTGTVLAQIDRRA